MILKDGLDSECKNQILVITVLLVVFYVVGLSCAESQYFENTFLSCMEPHAFLVLGLVYQHDKLNLGHSNSIVRTL